MDVYVIEDYRQLIRGLIESKPKQGYGQLTRLATHIGVNPTYLSQILSGLKNLSDDQGYLAAEFFGLNERETFYFLLLIQKERAGSHQVKKLIDRELKSRQSEAKKLKNRIVTETELTQEAKAIFYSDWAYTAIHALTSIEGYQTVDLIADHLALPRSRVGEIVDWLLRHGLCKEARGRLSVGPATTFVERESPLSTRHHSNWRLKAIEKMQRGAEEDFFFTAAFSVSEKDYQDFRMELVALIDKLAKRVGKSEPERLAAIDIDLFKV